MRYQKIVKTDGVETARYDYVYSDGTLVLITYTADGVSDTARFIYDSYGEPRGFILNNTAAYLYVKNAQGDITAIVNENGEVILTCTYDAWGNVNFASTSMTHMTLAAKLSQINPFTYRGYCYDYDIGVYYLQSRYYDPTICRFINADSTDYLGATGTLLSYNLFAYCENDGVNCLDATGTWAYDVHAGYYSKKKDATKKDISVDYVIGMNGKYIPYYTKAVRGERKHVYYGTYYWAIKCGIKASYAQIIAYNCNDVDKKYNPVTEQEWHFNVNWGSKRPDSRLLKTLEMSMCAISYFQKALKQPKGSKSYNNYVKKGLSYLGYALHPLQDIYAHTIDYCYKIVVPNETIAYGTSSITYTTIWSHIRPKDITDVAKKRTDQLTRTANKTTEILEGFVAEFPEIFK